MTTNEIRRRFLKFFEQRHGHRIMPSDSLVPPPEDTSLLFTGSGMNQFKPEFAGRPRFPEKRVVTSQKCLRTDDIPKVGRTAFHHTFFEMLGNFSFGDYFKRGAIEMAWEFLLEELRLPPERLQVSVHREDDEAFEIWEKHIGLSQKIIHRFGDKENFWPADCPKKGPNGLCGPCSEIFYDWGKDVGCRRPECNPSCDCGRFSEIWNLVFQQFDRKDGGVLEPLPTKNIDTGAGLERLAAVMQGVRSNFDIDIFLPILHQIERLIGRSYAEARDGEDGVRFRRIADFVRGVTFCIGDGVLPSNQGRGYVERKLIRQASLDAIHLGQREPILYALVPVIAETMGEQYPELKERQDNIARILRIEEERFQKTLQQGSAVLDDLIAKLREKGETTLPGEEAFRLFDTYGLPLDITETILADVGLKVDREGFDREMQKQRQKARASTRLSADIFGSGPLVRLKEDGAKTRFLGYDQDVTEGRVLGIVAGDDLVEMADEGEEVTVILDQSTFYGESGGQVGDSGILESSGCTIIVSDAQRGQEMILHIGKVARGRVRRGDTLLTKPDLERRQAIKRNHSATHLLHYALRTVLGKHAEQAGSLVAPDRLRFDFTHTKALTQEELERVEELVNEKILENAPIRAVQTTLADAKRAGAIALFGEKYGDEVRMICSGDFSKELCGGTHCRATGEIGLFRILSEQSVAAGVRRIEAVTGLGALRHTRAQDALIRALCDKLNAQAPRLLERADALLSQIKELRAELNKARQRGAGASVSDLLARAEKVGKTKIVAERVPDASPDDLRRLVDQLKREADSFAAILGSASAERANIVVGLSRDLIDRGLDAVQLVRECGKFIGGGGGGRPDLAQGGGGKLDGLDRALRHGADLVKKAVG